MQAAPTIEQLDPQHFMTGTYLYKDVQAYAALGEHRTATEVDRKTSQWLRQQLEGYGFSARLEPFAVRQFLLERTEMVLDSTKKIPCFPVWPPHASVQVARIVSSGPGIDADVRGGIALVKLPRPVQLHCRRSQHHLLGRLRCARTCLRTRRRICRRFARASHQWG